jgi:hypothetical protein
MQDKHIIKQQTETLIKYCQESDRIYEEVRGTGEDKDFYNEVKPFADTVHKEADKWGENMKSWISQEKFTHLFPQMIDQTVNNLSDVAVQAFFYKTSYKRFKSHVQSVSYILEIALSEINKKIGIKNGQ